MTTFHAFPPLTWLSNLAQDIRLGLRMLRKSPGFTIVTTLILALGIGANTVVFSLVDALMVRGLPFHRPQQLVLVWDSNPKDGFDQVVATGPNFLDWRQQNRSFQEMGAMSVGRGILTGEGEGRSMGVLSATPGFMRALGTQPVLGRVFATQEELSGQDQVVVLSHGLWKNRFHESRDIIGKTLLLDAKPRTVIGVLPSSMGFLDKLGEVYVPLTTDTLQQDRGSHLYVVLARLKPEVVLAQAQVEMQTIAARLEAQYPDKLKGWGVKLVRLPDQLAVFTRPVSLGLQVAALFVLAIICVNTANLLMGRAALRSREMAVRLALGCSRFRVLRQVLTESVLLAILGGAAGFLLSSAGIVFINRLLDARGFHLWNEIRPDVTVFVFTMGLAAMAGAGFGLLPALHASRCVPQDVLKQGRAATPGKTMRNLLGGLIVAEIGLALVLMIGAGLLWRNLGALHNVNPGFDPHQVLRATLSLPESRYPEGLQRTRFYESALQRLRELPQVSNAALTDSVPMTGLESNSTFHVRIEGRPEESEEGKGGAQFRRVSDSYFSTLRMTLIKGRGFTPQDRQDSSPVAILNQSMARRDFGRSDPLGAHITIMDDAGNPRTVVGVVSDERSYSLGRAPEPTIYVPFAQGNWSMDRHHPFNFLIRTQGDPLGQVSAVRRQIEGLDDQLALANLNSLEQLTMDSVLPQRLGTSILGAFALLAMALAALGIYGVMAGAVNARTQEIGIRMALGARPSEMIWMVLKRGLFLSVLGSAFGIPVALVLTRYLSFLLNGISPLDPIAFAGALVFLVACALLACWLPARRATYINPLDALRSE